MGDGLSAAARLEVVWRAYELETATALSRPPTDDERAAVMLWFRQQNVTGNGPSFIVRRPRLTPLVHETVSSKAWSITQLGCQVHSPDDVVLPPGAITMPIGIAPWSAQSAADKVAIRSAVTDALKKKRMTLTSWGTSPLCVTISAIVPHRSGNHHRRKDVDNLMKGLLDAMAGTADPGGHRNSSGPIFSIGLAKSNRLRGLSLSSAATESR